MAQARRGATASTSVVVDALRAAGTISRVGLTDATGLTGATVSTVVRRLIDDGLVREIGRAESTGGKPRVLLALDPTARYAVGVHLDHAALTYTVTDLAGASVGLMTREGPGSEGPQQALSRMAAEIDQLVAQAGIDRTKVLGIGLASPGPLSSEHGMHRAPPAMRSWTDYPISAELTRLTGLPVLLENDATASAIGEHWAGGTGAENSFVALYMGTGLGAGFLLDGIALRGSSGNAGEIGHTTLAVDGPLCWCGMRGCVELLAGPAAVVAEARSDPDLAAAAGLDLLDEDASVVAQFAAVARSALSGEPAARAVVERSARYVAAAALATVNLLDVRLVVLTGQSFAAAGDLYPAAVRELLAASSFARSEHGVEVRLSPTAATAPAVGGAALVLQSHLVPTLTPPPPSRPGSPPSEIHSLST